ncbi:MAG TPA: hypothetical protein ENJ95_12285 [Bacteroidetes bacterium]|nr:hypothetical protein [Bacteroidota bacterium]
MKSTLFLLPKTRTSKTTKPMRHSTHYRITLFSAIFCASITSSLSQTITFQNPDDFFVCGSATF